MPFEIIRNDLTRMEVDAIVNTANPAPRVGSGTDRAVHEKAGPGLLQARLRIGNIRRGESAITPAYNLNARYVIHTVGPVWRGGLLREEAVLRSCYDSALALALEHDCASIAFPLISAGNYGFPKDRVLKIATEAFRDFLAEHEMQIYLVVFRDDAFQLSRKLFQSIKSYIDDNYVETAMVTEYAEEGFSDFRHRNRRQEPEDFLWEEDDFRAEASAEPEGYCEPPAAKAEPKRSLRREPSAAPRRPQREQEKTVYPGASAPADFPAQYSASRQKAAPEPLSLAELLRKTDAGFSETLLQMIDRTGKKDSEIYTKANVSRQHFSKIRKNPDYRPTKATALAFAVALELDMEQTKDLIGRAGYALTRSSKFDVIIMYFIDRGNYNIFDINAALFEFDQSLLGA